MFDNEEWRPIEEFPHYLVSNLGRVKHVDRTEVRSLTTNNRGYPVIAITVPGNSTRYLRQVNKLVATAFLPPPSHSDENNIWHIDGDFSNCRSDNLRWERRDRVLEWNEMHRTGEPKYRTPPVRNNRTGITYANAYECAMAEGVIESAIVWRVERQALHIYDDDARYRYVTD